MVKKNTVPVSPLHRSPRKYKNKRQTVKAVKDAEPAPPPGADGGKLIWLLIRQLEDEQNRLVLFGKQSKDETHTYRIPPKKPRSRCSRGSVALFYPSNMIEEKYAEPRKRAHSPEAGSSRMRSRLSRDDTSSPAFGFFSSF
ncbi:hypothetical protein DFH09DRAFT_1070436 [Mycena vulgaris]|nr:hypothetical protein DFH09DRAFT_1070436 [Mycena vulgaris]